jgi:hypothetical protein
MRVESRRVSIAKASGSARPASILLYRATEDHGGLLLANAERLPDETQLEPKRGGKRRGEHGGDVVMVRLILSRLVGERTGQAECR